VRTRKCNGFSLTEMLIVCVLLGVVAAIATPSFISYRQNSNLREAARALASDIALYRQIAVTENRRYRIIFDQAANSYTVRREAAPNTNNYENLPSPVTKSPGDISSQVIISDNPAPSFSGGVPYFTIQPRGTMGAGSLKLRHTVSLSEKTITTNLMGRVKVE
jgi:prepilin-type N-terminal cleavage/methylation domain-containing protein